MHFIYPTTALTMMGKKAEQTHCCTEKMKRAKEDAFRKPHERREIRKSNICSKLLS